MRIKTTFFSSLMMAIAMLMGMGGSFAQQAGNNGKGKNQVDASQLGPATKPFPAGSGVIDTKGQAYGTRRCAAYSGDYVGLVDKYNAIKGRDYVAKNSREIVMDAARDIRGNYQEKEAQGTAAMLVAAKLKKAMNYDGIEVEVDGKRMNYLTDGDKATYRTAMIESMKGYKADVEGGAGVTYDVDSVERIIDVSANEKWVSENIERAKTIVKGKGASIDDATVDTVANALFVGTVSDLYLEAGTDLLANVAKK